MSVCYQCYCSVKSERERILDDYPDADDYCKTFKNFQFKNQQITYIATVAVVIRATAAEPLALTTLS